MTTKRISFEDVQPGDWLCSNGRRLKVTKYTSSGVILASGDAYSFSTVRMFGAHFERDLPELPTGLGAAIKIKGLVNRYVRHDQKRAIAKPYPWTDGQVFLSDEEVLELIEDCGGGFTVLSEGVTE